MMFSHPYRFVIANAEPSHVFGEDHVKTGKLKFSDFGMVFFHEIWYQGYRSIYIWQIVLFLLVAIMTKQIPPATFLQLVMKQWELLLHLLV